jgi:predicted regulator of Ras-like GTPase activity (Roadblock/LC7/MglB family)
LFEEIFTKIHDKNKELRCVGIWGKDGLELEKKVFSEYKVDIELMGAQLADALTRFESISLSSLHQTIRVIFPEYVLLVFSLTPDYFLVVLADRNIIPGKIDFYVRLHRDKFIAAF